MLFAEVSVFSIFNNSMHLKLISGDCLQLCGEADVSLQIVISNFNVTECVTRTNKSHDFLNVCLLFLFFYNIHSFHGIRFLEKSIFNR